MKYEIYIDPNISLQLFEKAWHTIEVRLDVKCIYDYCRHVLKLTCPSNMDDVLNETDDIYVIKKIEKVG